MRVVAIVNPAAGGGKGGKRALEALARLPGVVVRTTAHAGHATALAQQAVAEGASVVVAAGGDGTLNEVVNGLVPNEGEPGEENWPQLPALAVMPVGTGNSFVKDLGLSTPEEAVAAITRGARRPIDVLRFVHATGLTHSINLVSFGFSAEAGRLTNARFKGLGVVGYVAAVVVSLASLEAVPFPHALDGGPFDAQPATLLSLCNSQYTGGAMQMAPLADPGDGLVDVVRIGPMGRRRFLSSFPRIFQGTHLEMPEISTKRARLVRFEGVAAVPVMIDGEIQVLQPRSVTVLRHAIQVVA